MPDGLSHARALAESIRFFGDQPRAPKAACPAASTQLRSFFKHNELQISDAVTPSLFKVLATAAQRLRMKPHQIEAFVYESPNVQAACIVRDGDCCLIRMSSGLVNLLSPEELAFVVGHEVGHHLFSHTHATHEERSLEEQLAARAAEISADRTGLVACGSIAVAARALMKSLSGLPDRLIRFDISQYLAQFGNTSITTSSQNLTHPSMGVRCRALLWFSAATGATNGTVSEHDKVIVDDRVSKDLKRYIDSAAVEEIDSAERSLALWAAVDAIVRDGRLTKTEQEWLITIFGANAAGSVVAMLASCSREEAQLLVASRRDAAMERLKTLVPLTWAERSAQAMKLAESKPD